MFFMAAITFDPSDSIQETGTDDVQVSETFSTSNILQRFAMTMRYAGITNAVRLSHNETVMFDDQSGKMDDLTTALRSFAKKSSLEAKMEFEELRIELEHEGKLIRSVIDTRIEKTHGVDEFPIKLNIAGFMKDFAAENGQISPDRQNLFDQVFSEQYVHDTLTEAAFYEFNELVERIQASGNQHLIVDQIHLDSANLIIRTNQSSTEAIKGWESLFNHTSIKEDDIFYCYQWHQKCSENQIVLNNCDFFDPYGEEIPQSNKNVRIDPNSNPFSGLTLDIEDIQKIGWRLIGGKWRTRGEVWQAVADQIGFAFVKGGFFTRDSIEGRWKERFILVKDKTTSDENGTYPQLLMQAAHWAPFKSVISLHEDNFFSSLGKSIFGTQDIEIDHAEFDKRYILKGDKSVLQHLFGSPDVQQLIMLQSGLKIRIDRDYLQLKIHDTTEPNFILRLYELMVELIGLLESLPD